MIGVRTALLAEMASPGELVRALEELRERGYRRLDARASHEVEGLDHALDLPRPYIPWWTLAGGLSGGVGAYLIQWWTAAVDFPLNVGGRPLHSAPAFIPITFESTILFGGLATFVGLVVHAKLGRLWQPLDEVPQLASATVDAMWIVVDGADPRFDWDETPRQLRELGALRVIAVREPEEERA